MELPTQRRADSGPQESRAPLMEEGPETEDTQGATAQSSEGNHHGRGGQALKPGRTSNNSLRDTRSQQGGKQVGQERGDHRQRSDSAVGTREGSINQTRSAQHETRTASSTTRWHTTATGAMCRSRATSHVTE
eukprot:11500102-Karenia_brevis.AAC.1